MTRVAGMESPASWTAVFLVMRLNVHVNCTDWPGRDGVETDSQQAVGAGLARIYRSVLGNHAGVDRSIRHYFFPSS